MALRTIPPTITNKPYTAVASTATQTPNYGLVSIAGATGAKTWLAPIPRQGLEVNLVCLDAATGAVQTMSKSGVAFLSTAGTKSTISFNHDYESCTLVGINSSQWVVFGQSAIASS